MSILSQGFPLPPIKRVPVAKGPGDANEHSSPSSAEFTSERSYTFSSPYIFITRQKEIDL
jgi:hypothetical protein